MRALTSPSSVPFGVWVQAARLKFLPQGVFPVIIAGAAAFAAGVFNPLYFIIAFLAASAVQIGLTMFNDTLDFQYGTDKSTAETKNPFSGGSGVLASGRVKPRQAMTVIIGLYVFALICGIFFAFAAGIGSLYIAGIGAFISIAYSARPFRLAYRGLGELAMLVGYGPVLTAWAYFIHTSSLSLDIVLVGIIPGLCMWTMILINEIPDYAEDKAAGKKNLTYRLTPRGSKNLFIASLASIYVYIAVLIGTGVLPPVASLTFLGVPLAVSAARTAHREFKDPLKIAKANKYMVLIYSLTNAAVAIGFMTA
ncbi:1,4-dihydroxy-2-naphthoate octaprenyltransferase [Dehalogenimonas formicexedens]|uniref:1,4-dihydroxy-2-naphthoate octaprenyltransferase n=1 Tax=Dehalogenimonas formicexedens TaxID=1839801 RepID=A0A1P8F4U9_9CHLR|nr:prenyltransferase [Dehalogenimonas formicexedens]APV43501.1 1,4-dihydroxy-2-naphthoate octaprenyltransferase [Dehalogenimonas formicexedens]